MTTGAPTQEKPKEKPRYQLTEKAYINDRLFDPELMPYEESNGEDEAKRKPLIVAYDGIPGAHMIPMNAAAKAMVEKHKAQYERSLNPVNSLTIVGATEAAKSA